MVPENSDSDSDEADDNSLDSDNYNVNNLEELDDGFFIDDSKDIISPVEDGDKELITLQVKVHVVQAKCQLEYAIQL